MRLQTIKTEISNLPYISFEEYFHQYVFSVQDSNIDDEMHFFVNNNFLSPETLSNAIGQVKKEVIEFD